MKKTSRLFLNLLGIFFLVFLTILVGRGFQARSLPDLEPWHRADLGDVKAGELPETATLADYLGREDAVFAALKTKVLANVAAGDRTSANRYSSGGPLDPTRLGAADGNRTFELAPETVRGSALLLHGLTDAPYSVRPIAEALRKVGYVALAPRLPGHGTAPSGLVSAEWPDWMSVVRLAARHVAAKAPGKPFVIVGYSNGGALAVKYAQDVLEGSGLPRPDRIVLMSPMIGLTPFASLARVVSLLRRIPFFEKNAWLDVVPEYNPYKYNSFPANAAIQTSALTEALNAQTERLAGDGRLKDLAPVLAFVSLVDDTVLTEATVHRLYDRLPANGSELVLFDVNRHDTLAPFLKPAGEALARELKARTDLRYRLTVVTNARRDALDVVARSWGPGPVRPEETALGLAWPPGVFSLSHVAIPFPESDDLYGGQPDPPPTFGLRLGRIGPRGERAVLTVPLDQWMRLTWNPFYSWMEARAAAWAATSSSAR